MQSFLDLMYKPKKTQPSVQEQISDLKSVVDDLQNDIYSYQKEN
jgi:hypothetical protein